MPYLKRDVYSLLNPSQCYGRQGTEVAVVSISGHVVIVKAAGEENYGFSCLDYDLVDQRIHSAEPGESNPAKGERSKKGRWNESSPPPKAETQSTLF